MKKNTLLFGILLLNNTVFAQTDIKRYHSFLIYSDEKSRIIKQKNKTSSLFEQNKPFFLQYIPKRENCFFLLVSQTSICFNHEINMEAMSKQTKSLFFKMKMWGWFVGRTSGRK